MPALHESCIKVREALEKNEVVVIACTCEIWYSGRAESRLAEGDRIIIIKTDGTFLVHQPSGSTPVNYMKDGSKHTINHHSSALFINSANITRKEYLDVKIKKIHFIQSSALNDNNKIELSGSEKDMSDMIYKNPTLIEQGFKPLNREEHTKYGFIDVFGYDKKGELVIIECKRYSADLGAVSQLRRYVEKVKKAKGIPTARGILAAPRISPNALKMLQDWGFEFKQVNPPKYLERYNKDQKSIFDY